MACNAKFGRLLDSLLTGGLPERRWRRFQEHQRACDLCRAHYNRVVLAERLLHGGPAALRMPSAPELDRVFSGVLADLAAARPRPLGLGERLVRWFAPTPRWATAVAAVLAALVLTPLLLRQAPQPSAPETFQARGGAGRLPAVGLRAFCLTEKTVVPLDPGPGVAPRCSHSALIKFTATNRSQLSRLFLVGLDERHELKWYAPRPPIPESIPAPAPGSVDAPVDRTRRIAVNHRPGLLRVFALFSERPVTVPEVEAAAEAMLRSGAAIATTEVIPLRRADVQQRSLLIEITP